MTALALSRRTRKRLIERGLDVLTWLVLVVMISPVLWLVASSLQTDGDLARGTYNLAHPTFTAFRDMWSTVEFSRYLINSVIICTSAAALATVFASTAGYALARFRYITLPLMRPLIGIQLLFGVIYSTYQFAIPYVMLGSNPGSDADLMMTLIVRQSFSNNLFGFGAAASTLVMFAMAVWVLFWYAAFRRDMEVR